ncbi:MAG: hypothetical protein A2X36_10475 [Elusimicrobia bacterium GWA2_69_24]|nr:MAG: hypothetical protein A2X36_10475 [Elusimicrobia bacterium GWA2_69_24]
MASLKLTDGILSGPASDGVRAVASSLMDAAQEAHLRMDDPQDAEALHDFRVSLRRLRSSLRFYRPLLGGALKRKVLRRLKGVAAATNPGRDAEVQAACLRDWEPLFSARVRHGVSLFRAQVEARRDAAYAAGVGEARAAFHALEPVLRGAFTGPRTEEASADRAPLAPGPTFALAAGESILCAAEDMRKCLYSIHPQSVSRNPGPSRALEMRAAQGATNARADRHVSEEQRRDATQIERSGDGRDFCSRSQADAAIVHSARITGKRLRYLLEPFQERSKAWARCIKALKALQDILGELHDLHILSLDISHAAETGAVEEVRRRFSLKLGTAAPPAPARRKDPLPGLIRLAKHVRDRERLLHRRLHRSWGDVRRARFFGEVAALAESLRRIRPHPHAQEASQP